jgi:hypothetical protein
VRGIVRLALAAALAASCGSPPPKPELPQTVDDATRGIRYVVPPGWQSFDGEIHSPRGSFLSVRVFSLAGAKATFVAGLPDTLLPQLDGEGRYYFVVEGNAARRETTVAGGPATEFTYVVRVRPKDSPSRTIYWVVKREEMLYLLRATFPPAALEQDEPAVRSVVESWRFPALPRSSAPLP